MAKSEARYTITHTISHIAHRVPSQKKTGRAFFSFLLLEPVVGVEPTTCCLRISCASVHRHPHLSITPSECGCAFHSFHERLPLYTPLAICWQYAVAVQDA